MSNFKRVRASFGVIKNIEVDNDGSLFITNEHGHRVKMSNKYGKWAANTPEVKIKCVSFKDQKVDILTSQTTAPWKPYDYFCDVILVS